MPIKKWKLLGSKTVFKNRWWNVVQETVELPDGSITDDYYVNRIKGGAGIFALTEDGKVVLNRQYKHGIREIVEELTIGQIDDEDADPMEAAKRELLEETGYGGGSWEKLAVMTPNPTSSTSRIYLFLARGVRRLQAPKRDPRESVETSLVTPKELWEKMMRRELSTDVSVALVTFAFERMGWLDVRL